MPEVVVPPPEAATVGSGMFACRYSRVAGAARVTPAGELDIAAVPGLDRVLRRAAAVADTVVLDLRSVEFIDAGATAFLLAAHRRIDHDGGRLIVVRGSIDIGWILALAGIDRHLELVDQPPCAGGGRTPSPAPPRETGRS